MMNKAIKLLILLAAVQNILTANETGLSISLEPGFIIDHIGFGSKVNLTHDYDIPDYLDGNIMLSQYRVKLPLSFDHSRLYIVEKKCQHCLINKYKLSNRNGEVMNKMYQLCSQDYENCKFYSYNGLKGYEFTVFLSISSSIDAKIDVILVNSFDLKTFNIMIPWAAGDTPD